MSVMDFARGAPDGGGGQDPMAALMAGAGAGGPAEMPPPEAGSEGPEGQSTIDILNQMLELAKLYIDTDEDEEDKLTMSKILTMLQGYLAEEQKESMNAMQGKLSPKLLAQSYGG